MLVKCGFSRFTEDSCGHTIASSECISLSRCSRDIKPHLRGLNVIDASLRSEIQLLWARAGNACNRCKAYVLVSSTLNVFMKRR